MPVTILPNPLEGLSESVGRGLQIGQRGRALSQRDRQLSLLEEQAKAEAAQREFANRIKIAEEERALSKFQGQQASLEELVRRRQAPPPGQLSPPQAPGPPSLESGLNIAELRARADIGVKVPAPSPKDKKLTPIQMLDKSVALWDKDPALARKLGNEALKQSGTDFRFSTQIDSQVGKGLNEQFIAYNEQTANIDFNLPKNAADLDKIESGLLENLAKTETYQRATPKAQTSMTIELERFFEAKRKMRQKSRTVRETILGKVANGEALTKPEQKVYDDIIKRRELQTPEEAGRAQFARTTQRLRAYRTERLKAITTNNLDDLRSLIFEQETALVGADVDLERVDALMWKTIEKHYSTKRKQEISPEEADQLGEQLEADFNYDEATIIRLLDLQFKVIR